MLCWIHQTMEAKPPSFHFKWAPHKIISSRIAAPLHCIDTKTNWLPVVLSGLHCSEWWTSNDRHLFMDNVLQARGRLSWCFLGIFRGLINWIKLLSSKSDTNKWKHAYKTWDSLNPLFIRWYKCVLCTRDGCERLQHPWWRISSDRKWKEGGLFTSKGCIRVLKQFAPLRTDVSCTLMTDEKTPETKQHNTQPDTQTSRIVCTHWFSSTSRMNFRPKALTWKLAWARWLTCGGRDHVGFFYTLTKCSCSYTVVGQFYWYARVNSNLHGQLPAPQ